MVQLSDELTNTYKYMEGVCKVDEARLFPVLPGERTRGNGHKMKCRRFCLNIRKHFTVRVTEPWCRILRENEESSSLTIFKSCLDMFPNKHL